VGAFEDAVSRIRGPSIDELLTEDSPTWVEQSEQPAVTTTPTTQRPLGVPSRGSITRTPTSPTPPDQTTTKSVGPSGPPSSLTPPPRRPKNDEGLMKSFLLDPLWTPVDRMARSPYYPMAARTIGAVAGATAGSYVGMPTAGATAGAALVEKFAAEPSERLQGHEPNPLMAPVNVAVAAAGGALERPAAAMVRPALRVGTGLIEATGLNELWEVARGLFDEGKVDWQQVSEAGSNPWNLVALPFGAADAIKTNAAMARLKAQRAELPALIYAAHAENGGATFSYGGGNRIGEKGQASVSIYPERSEVIEGEVTPGHFQTYIDRNKDLLLHDERINVGSWYDSSTGKTYLDLAAVMPREEAIEQGKRYNQKAVFDLEKMEEIPTGGTGDPIEGLLPEAQRLPRIKMKAYPDELQSIVDQGHDSAERLAKWYRQSKLSDERGTAGPDKAAPLEDVSDTAFRFDPKKMGVSDQAIRFNLAREAGKNITETAGVLKKEDWTASMIEKYGPRVARHVNTSWERAVKAIERRYLAMGRKDLPGVDHWASLVEHGKDAEPFYGPANATLTKVFGPDVDKFLDFYAATSPRTDTDRNLQQALRWYVAWKTGEPIRGGLFPQWGERIAANDPNWGGDKVRAFRANLGGRGHPSGNNRNRITIDTWQQEGMGYELVSQIDPHTGERTTDMPSMSDMEYALNEDYLRAQADALKMPVASLMQELSWAGIRKTSNRQGGRRRGSGLAPHVIIERRFKDGLTIFDQATIEAFEPHELKFAQEIDRLMAERGATHPEAVGLAEAPAAGAFDWGTGEYVGEKPAKAKRSRKNQRGSTKLDNILPVWAMFQVAKGVNTFAKFAGKAVERFGQAIRPALPRAWQEGRRRAFKMAAAAPALPEMPEQKFTEGSMPTVAVEKERTEFTTRYGKAGTLMADMLEKHADEIATATGGVQDDVELQRLADQVKTDMVGLVEKFGKGRGNAASAAEIKHITDLSYTLDQRLKTKLDERATRESDGTWSPQDEAELADLENDYANLHAVRKGSAAEAGRALRAHQIAGTLRNKDLDALLNFARNRGLKHEDISLVFAQHKDPLSRAQAIQTMTGLTASRLYTHARYWTMLADPATWYIAGFGNVVDGMVREFGKSTGSAADAIFHRGNRWMYAREFNPRQAGTIRGMFKGFRRAYEVMTEGTTAESIAAGKAPPEEFFAERPIAGVAANLPFRALSASDVFATTMFGEAEMNGFAFARAMKHSRDRGMTGSTAEQWAMKQAAEWVSTPPEWLLLHTDRMTKQLGLQSPLGATGKMLQGFLHRLPRPVQTFVLPFIATGINAVKQGGKKLPVVGQAVAHRYGKAAESFESARELAKKRGIRVSDVSRMEAESPGSFQDSLSREAAVTRGEAQMGTAIMASLPLLVMAGLGDITGDPPKDVAERERLQKERPFNAIRVGSLWLDQRMFGSLEPILRAIGNGKQTFDIVKRRKVEGVDETWQRASEALVQVLQGLPKSGPLRSLNGLLNLQDVGVDSFYTKAGSMFRDVMVVPTLAEKVQKYTDPYERRIENFLDPTIGAFQPSRLSPRLDPLGDPVPRRPLPFQVGSRPDDYLNEAAKAGVALTSPNEKTMKIGAREVPLNLRDRRVLNRALGLANRAAAKTLIGNRERWASMRPEGRHAALLSLRDELRGAVHDVALGQVHKGEPLQMERLVRPLSRLLGLEQQP